MKISINTHANPSEMIPVSVLQRLHRFLEGGDTDELESQSGVPRPEYLQNIGQKLKNWVNKVYFPVIEQKMITRTEEKYMKELFFMCDKVTDIFKIYDARFQEDECDFYPQGVLSEGCHLIAPGWQSRTTFLVALFNEFILGNNTNARDIDVHTFSDANVVLFTLTRGCGVAFAISEFISNQTKGHVILRFDIFCDITPRELSYYDNPPQDQFLNSALIEYMIETNANSSWREVTGNYEEMLRLFHSTQMITWVSLEFTGDGSHTDAEDYWQKMFALFFRIPKVTTDGRDLVRESDMKQAQNVYPQNTISLKHLFKVYSNGDHYFIWIFEHINPKKQSNVTPPRSYLLVYETPDTPDYEYADDDDI